MTARGMGLQAIYITELNFASGNRRPRGAGGGLGWPGETVPAADGSRIFLLAGINC